MKLKALLSVLLVCIFATDAIAASKVVKRPKKGGNISYNVTYKTEGPTPFDPTRATTDVITLYSNQAAEFITGNLSGSKITSADGSVTYSLQSGKIKLLNDIILTGDFKFTINDKIDCVELVIKLTGNNILSAKNEEGKQYNIRVKGATFTHILSATEAKAQNLDMRIPFERDLSNDEKQKFAFLNHDLGKFDIGITISSHEGEIVIDPTTNTASIKNSRIVTKTDRLVDTFYLEEKEGYSGDETWGGDVLHNDFVVITKNRIVKTLRDGTIATTQGNEANGVLNEEGREVLAYDINVKYPDGSHFEGFMKDDPLYFMFKKNNNLYQGTLTKADGSKVQYKYGENEEMKAKKAAEAAERKKKYEEEQAAEEKQKNAAFERQTKAFKAKYGASIFNKLHKKNEPYVGLSMKALIDYCEQPLTPRQAYLYEQGEWAWKCGTYTKLGQLYNGISYKVWLYYADTDGTHYCNCYQVVAVNGVIRSIVPIETEFKSKPDMKIKR